MSKIPIVARRRRFQLATTAPVLFFTWAMALCYELLAHIDPVLLLTSTGMMLYES